MKFFVEAPWDADTGQTSSGLSPLVGALMGRGKNAALQAIKCQSCLMMDLTIRMEKCKETTFVQVSCLCACQFECCLTVATRQCGEQSLCSQSKEISSTVQDNECQTMALPTLPFSTIDSSGTGSKSPIQELDAYINLVRVSQQSCCWKKRS